MSTLAISLFVAWAVAAALAQHPALFRVIGGRRTLGLVPNFLFFTSRIVGNELELLVREESPPEAFGAWREVPTVRSRTLVSFLWNPGRRVGKAHLDLALQLVELRLSGRRQEAPGSAAYAVLARCAGAEVSPGRRYQFAIRATPSLEPGGGQLLFVSEPCGP
jgi:hypothetical protein